MKKTWTATWQAGTPLSAERGAQPGGSAEAQGDLPPFCREPSTRTGRVISLLSDYGLEDGLVGSLHGVLRSYLPGVAIVDITHGVPAHDVRAGSLALLRAAPYLAPGVVLAVVDPRVGTERRAVAVKAARASLTFVGPDNGLLLPALDALGGPASAVELTDRGYWLETPGPTFAGRDIFAPAAARLAAGASLEDLGVPIDTGGLVGLPAPLLSRLAGGSFAAEVTWIDRFGNVQLAARREELPEGTTELRVSIGCPGRSSAAKVAAAYGQLAPGELGLLVDSYGHLALSLNEASAAESLGVGEQEVVIVEPLAPQPRNSYSGA